MSVGTFAIEASSVFGWWFGFHFVESILPANPVSTVAAGSLSGLLVATACLPRNNARLWPETVVERRMMQTRDRMTILRLGANHSVFWLMYQALRNSIHSARLKQGRVSKTRDLEDVANDFFSAGIAGMCYRASSLPYSTGPLQVPLTAKLVAQTSLKMALLCTAFETVDFYIRDHFAKQNEEALLSGK